MTINAPDNSAESRYIQSLSLNGQLYGKNWISHKTLMNGGTLHFRMTATPNKQRGVTAGAYPFSFSIDNSF